MSKKGDYQCPYCQVWIHDDEGVFADQYDVEDECPECEKKFRVSGAVTIEYSAVGDCKLAGMLPHRLRVHDMLCLRDSPEKDYECQQCRQVFYHFYMPGGRFPKLQEGEFIIEGTK